MNTKAGLPYPPFTLASKFAVKLGLRLAGRFFQEAVEPVHVLLGLLRTSGNANEIFQHLGTTTKGLHDEAWSVCKEMPFCCICMGTMPQSVQLRRVIDGSMRDWQLRPTTPAVTTANLLKNLADEHSDIAAKLLHKYGLTSGDVEDHMWVTRDSFWWEGDEIYEIGGQSDSFGGEEF